MNKQQPNVFYRHYRKMTFAPTAGAVLSPTGGLTVRFEKTDEQEGSRQYAVSFALVNDKDLYCKKTGRELADERHHAFDLVVKKNQPIDEALGTVLSDESIDFPLKRRMIKKVMEINESMRRTAIEEAVRFSF